MPRLNIGALPDPSFISDGRFLRLVGIAGLVVALAGCVGAQPRPSPNTKVNAQDRQEMERQIQKCIRDRTASPKLCRLSAYSAALAAGLPPDEAAYVTGYRP